MHPHRILVAALLAVTLPATACSPEGDTGGGGPTVVATTDIWADVASHVACDGPAEVTALMPTGADPHEFEPSLADRGRLGEADLVVANGLDLEQGLASSFDDVRADGVHVFRAADHVDPGDGRLAGDPHIWLDPARAADAAEALGDTLVDDVGLDSDAVDACVESYTAELDALDAEMSDILEAVPADQRLLVTNHDAFGYLADHFGFEIVGTVIPSTSSLAETNPADMARLADTIDDTGVRAVFTEAELSSADIDALAGEVGGVEVVTLLAGSLGDEGSGADTYVGLMRSNAQRIADGLGG